MPYFIFRISPEIDLTYIENFEGYKDAKNTARSIRMKQEESDKDTIKVIFAKDQDEAETLLLMPRKPRPKGEDA
jgi:hypothetical protein